MPQAEASKWWWLLLPLVAYALSHALLVRPAQRQLRVAQEALLDAEREELAAEMALEREHNTRQRLQQEVHDLAENAERMRRAEREASAQLDALARGRRRDFVLPGESRSTST